MRIVFMVLSSLILLCGPVLAAEMVGSIKSITGKGYVVRDGELQPVDVGARVLAEDVLVTVKNSTMGVLFRDDTQMALGPESELRIDSFVFDPSHDNVEFLTNMRVGTVAFFSGKIAKLAPDRVHVETPLATIGIRGTRFVVTVPKQAEEGE